MTEQPPFEHQKWVYEQNRQDAHRAHDASTEFWHRVNDAALENANLALRTAVLINGGAAIAILTFVGGMAAKDKVGVAQVTAMAGSILWFAFGVAFAALAMLFAYFTNYSVVAVENSKIKIWEHPYIQPGPRTKWLFRLSKSIHFLAVLFGFTSLVLFVVGMFAVWNSLVSLALSH